ncbi:TetR family transcriptional regulator [Motilibacter rhizosphaerae]|uniref:TetR family transcriptional regulator n=1 Tax=Motilibacter rhizosphaerae TaxID=598652 RepID=A0A4Q7NTI8_9ACTN|nr:TetR family transcriptional regulator [Motilibacter rhizosphaerae]
MREVVRRAGVGRSAFYTRWDGREQMVEEVHASAAAAVHAAAVRCAHPDWSGRAPRGLLGLLEELAHGGDVALAVRLEPHVPGGERVVRELGGALELLVEDGRRRGELRADLALDDVLALLPALAGLSGASGAPGAPAEVRERVVRLLHDALRPRGGGPPAAAPC